MEDRTIRIPLHEDVAEVLKDNQQIVHEMVQSIEKLRDAIQTVGMLDNKTLNRIIAKAGHNPDDFGDSKYEDTENGTVLVITRKPLPIPTQPTPVAPAGE
jgi:hypothetical protein